MKKMQIVIGAAVLLLTALAALTAQASVTVGTWQVENCYLYSCMASDGGLRYQQVFSSSAFSGSMAINTISVYKAEGGPIDTTTYTLHLSTTSKAVGSLDTSNPLNNLGSNDILFGQFTLSGTMPDILTFSGMAFDYDPSMGNLLLDVTVSNATLLGGQNAYFQADFGGNLSSRLYAFANGAGQDSNGPLVTTFDFVPPSTNVPEPMSLSMLGLGLAGMAAVRRRKSAGR